jgi:hypothetical protein
MEGGLFTLLSNYFFPPVFLFPFIPSTTFVAFNFLLISELTCGFNGVKGGTVLKNTFGLRKIYKLLSVIASQERHCFIQ